MENFQNPLVLCFRFKFHKLYFGMQPMKRYTDVLSRVLFVGELP